MGAHKVLITLKSEVTMNCVNQVSRKLMDAECSLDFCSSGSVLFSSYHAGYHTVFLIARHQVLSCRGGNSGNFLRFLRPLCIFLVMKRESRTYDWTSNSCVGEIYGCFITLCLEKNMISMRPGQAVRPVNGA